MCTLQGTHPETLSARLQEAPGPGPALWCFRPLWAGFELHSSHVWFLVTWERFFPSPQNCREPHWHPHPAGFWGDTLARPSDRRMPTAVLSLRALLSGAGGLCLALGGAAGCCVLIVGPLQQMTTDWVTLNNESVFSQF